MREINVSATSLIRGEYYFFFFLFPLKKTVGGGTKGETENLKQAVCPARSPMQDLNPTNLKSGLEPKSS